LKESIFIIIVFSLLYTSCTSSVSPPTEINSTLYSASELSIFNNQLIVAGTAKATPHSIAIKSPCLMTLDSSLNMINTTLLNTETTASNIIFEPVNNEECVIAFYAAMSLENQEEQTQVKILSQDLIEKNNHRYGNRTRIKDLAKIDSDVITLNYERTDRTMSLRSIKKFDIRIQEGDETNIPIDMIVVPNKEIFISGIANGFHYLDGHNYEQELAYGFLRKYDLNGQELNRSNYKQSGHVFFSDMAYHKEVLSVIGSKQASRTGMDVLLLQFDNQLNILTEKSFAEVGIQEGRSIEYIDNSIYIFGSTEDLITHKMNLQLTCLTVNGTLKWQKPFGNTRRTYSAIDMILFDSNIILLSQSKENRISAHQIHVHKVTLTGDLIDEKQLN